MSKLPDIDIVEDINKFMTEADEAGEAPEAPQERPEATIQDDEMMNFNASALEGETLNTGRGHDNVIYSVGEENWEKTTNDFMRDGVPAVIVVGDSGVGKTYLIKKAADKYGLKLAIFTGPTMDPFVDLIGIPSVVDDTSPKKEMIPADQFPELSDTHGKEFETLPVKKQKLEFIRSLNLSEANVLFLDEVNRAPMATQNAVFELVQDRKINGVPLPNLKAVWMAINPPRAELVRKVQELEDALQGRIHEIIRYQAKPKVHHYLGKEVAGDKYNPKTKQFTNVHGKLSEGIVRGVLKWWYQYIKGKTDTGADGIKIPLQDIITPRVLEYIMGTLQKIDNYKTGRVVNPDYPWDKREFDRLFESIDERPSIGGVSFIKKDGTMIDCRFRELKLMFQGRELFALSALRDGDPELPETLEKFKKDETSQSNAMRQMYSALRPIKDTPLALAFYEIGQYSTVLLTVKKAQAMIVMDRPAIAGYLFVKCNWTDEQKVACSATVNNKHLLGAATPEEKKLYAHFAYDIQQIFCTAMAGVKIPPGAPMPKTYITDDPEFKAALAAKDAEAAAKKAGGVGNNVGDPEEQATYPAQAFRNPAVDPTKRDPYTKKNKRP